MSYYEELLKKKGIKLDIMTRQRRGLPTPSMDFRKRLAPAQKAEGSKG
jgi:hypothetical protein